MLHAPDAFSLSSWFQASWKEFVNTYVHAERENESMRVYRILVNNCLSLSLSFSFCLVSIARQTLKALQVYHYPCYFSLLLPVLFSNCSSSSSSSSCLSSCLLDIESTVVCAARTCRSIPRLSRSSLVLHFVNWERSDTPLLVERLNAKFRYRCCRLTKYRPRTAMKRAAKMRADTIAIWPDCDNQLLDAGGPVTLKPVYRKVTVFKGKIAK